MFTSAEYAKKNRRGPPGLRAGAPRGPRRGSGPTRRRRCASSARSTSRTRRPRAWRCPSTRRCRRSASTGGSARPAVQRYLDIFKTVGETVNANAGRRGPVDERVRPVGVATAGAARPAPMSPGARPVLEARGIYKIFVARGGSQTRAMTALRDVSLDVRRGEFLALIGPSGCGKSTVLNMFAGLVGADRRPDPPRRARGPEREHPRRLRHAGRQPPAVADDARPTWRSRSS